MSTLPDFCKQGDRREVIRISKTLKEYIKTELKQAVLKQYPMLNGDTMSYNYLIALCVIYSMNDTIKVR